MSGYGNREEMGGDWIEELRMERKGGNLRSPLQKGGLEQDN